jgi:ATP-dependent exoDNAse (exonuclease V) beta subunit
MPEDIEHLQHRLGFKIPLSLDHPLTGHVDFLQIRNGAVHILDYKPDAEVNRPIEQLTLYALALSRLTGLRLFDFKCAWFNQNVYYEFFPLHVLHKRA